MMLQNRQVTVKEVAHQLQISHGSTYEIIHNRLAFHKVCSRLVPEQRETFGHCKRPVDRCGAKGDHFLERMVAGD
jgi:hypothetical protein